MTADFLAAIDQTIKPFNDGDIVEGTIVKVDRDEVLLDIGYKTEGVTVAPLQKGHATIAIKADGTYKAINDKWGHLAGDTVLKDYAYRVSSRIRRELDWQPPHTVEQAMARP